jgi:hypothetical protein
MKERKNREQSEQATDDNSKTMSSRYTNDELREIANDEDSSLNARRMATDLLAARGELQ